MPRGMQVMGIVRSGALAEYVAVTAEAVRILQDGTFAEAGPRFAQISHGPLCADRARKLQAGEQMLVPGAAGGVGTAAIHLGKIFGGRVIAAASTEEKRKFCARSITRNRIP